MYQPPSWLGRTLNGRYKLESILGQGGMGALYQATDASLQRQVTIRLFEPDPAMGTDFAPRFERAASAAARLRHPGIAQIYDFNHEAGAYYLVSEFIPSEPLSERLKRLAENQRQLEIPEAVRYTLDVSEALAYAHPLGLVHADLKPANIVLAVRGHAILTDFGILNLLGGDRQTAVGATTGTARYMAPEVIRGEAADARSDIYALGLVLFEMLTGRPPYLADSALTLMMMHLHDPLPDARTWRRELSASLIAILELCLAKDPQRRYRSAAELAANLRRVQANEGYVSTVGDEVPWYVELKTARPVPTQLDKGTANVGKAAPREPARPPHDSFLARILRRLAGDDTTDAPPPDKKKKGKGR